MQQLFFRELGEQNEQSLIILHGLFGASDNWLTLGKRFAENYHVFIVDQRNHGQSFHSTEFSYKVMSADLLNFFQAQKIESAHLLGHSMGGKTAMEFAVTNPLRIDKLVVGDIGPKSYPVHHSAILKGLFSIDLASLESRKQADGILSEYVAEPGIRQFLLKNLTRNSNGFEWKINLESIANSIEEVGFGLSENYQFDKPTLFIRGGKSDYVLDDDVNGIRSVFINLTLKTIENAGHWLHAEQPERFLELTSAFLKE